MWPKMGKISHKCPHGQHLHTCVSCDCFSHLSKHAGKICQKGLFKSYCITKHLHLLPSFIQKCTFTVICAHNIFAASFGLLESALANVEGGDDELVDNDDGGEVVHDLHRHLVQGDCQVQGVHLVQGDHLVQGEKECD